MADRRGLFAGVSWLQLIVSVLAAVTAAWIASRLGVAGTVVGAALGSLVVTISSAIYGRGLDKGKTLIVQTASGTMIQRAVNDDEVAEAIEEAEDADDAPVEQAHVVDEPSTRLHWKTIAVTTVVVLSLALAAITTYELVTDKTLDGSSGTSIGDTFGGGGSGRSDPAPAPEATTPTPTDPTTTPTPSVVPAPTAPTATIPSPAPTTSPTGTPTPTPTATTPTATTTPTVECAHPRQC